MVFLTENPKRVLAACCNVDVIKGADALDCVGFSSMLETMKLAPDRTFTMASASSLLPSFKVLPLYLVASRRRSSPAAWLLV